VAIEAAGLLRLVTYSRETWPLERMGKHFLEQTGAGREKGGEQRAEDVTITPASYTEKSSESGVLPKRRVGRKHETERISRRTGNENGDFWFRDDEGDFLLGVGKIRSFVQKREVEN